MAAVMAAASAVLSWTAWEISYCHKMLGDKARGKNRGGKNRVRKSSLSAEQLGRFKKVLAGAKFEKPKFHTQRASGPNVSADDYTLFPATRDPLGLAKPTWEKPLGGAFHDHARGGGNAGWQDHHIFSQPVVTEDSIIYRHKNIIYARAILNGELRWQNDIGGRAVWQNRHGRRSMGT